MYTFQSWEHAIQNSPILLEARTPLLLPFSFGSLQPITSFWWEVTKKFPLGMWFQKPFEKAPLKLRNFSEDEDLEEAFQKLTTSINDQIMGAELTREVEAALVRERQEPWRQAKETNRLSVLKPIWAYDSASCWRQVSFFWESIVVNSCYVSFRDWESPGCWMVGIAKGTVTGRRWCFYRLIVFSRRGNGGWCWYVSMFGIEMMMMMLMMMMMMLMMMMMIVLD